MSDKEKILALEMKINRLENSVKLIVLVMFLHVVLNLIN